MDPCSKVYSNPSGSSKSSNMLPMLFESSTDSCLASETQCSSDNSICFNGCGLSSFPSHKNIQTAFSRSCISVLHEHGYNILNKICDTLQGELILAETKSENGTFHKVAIKRTDKTLHEKKICIDENNETYFLLDENIISEGIILNIVSNNDCPGDYVCKFIEFFQSESDHYLVMEYISSQLTIRQFCKKAHQYINQGILQRKEWDFITKHIISQLANTLDYMHNSLNISHLDLTSDNIMIENGTFVIDEDGEIRINPSVSIKICDFGLSEMFDPDDLKCDKQPPQFELNYKAPQIFNDEDYNPIKADIWSLGIILYEMVFNCFPYGIQNQVDDKRYALMLENNVPKIIQMNKLKVNNTVISSLLARMLNVNEKDRCDITHVLNHKWLKYK